MSPKLSCIKISETSSTTTRVNSYFPTNSCQIRLSALYLYLMANGKQRNSTHYGDYLQLNKILDAQKPLTPTHDEPLFIIVHQAFELWFKQITLELGRVLQLFERVPLPERQIPAIVFGLERIQKILLLFPPQFDVLETMPPMNFVEFRNLLHPASGFQSIQFRKVEIMLGLKTNKRAAVDGQLFIGHLSPDEQEELKKLEKKPTLLEHLNQWLARMPFARFKNFDFWHEYARALETQERQNFDNLLADKTHGRLSQQAALNALFIMLFRDEPVLTWPYKILASLIDIDEHLTTWRYRHALMAQRMLGGKAGTGGSSGHNYLKMTAEKNRIFVELFSLSSYLIPQNILPPLPSQLKKEMGFVTE